VISESRVIASHKLRYTYPRRKGSQRSRRKKQVIEGRDAYDDAAVSDTLTYRSTFDIAQELRIGIRGV